MLLNLSQILPATPTWDPDMRTEKSPPCTACSAASSSRRSSSDARSMVPGPVARRATLPLLLGFAATLDFESIVSLHAVKTHSRAPRRKVQISVRRAIERKMRYSESRVRFYGGHRRACSAQILANGPRKVQY